MRSSDGGGASSVKASACCYLSLKIITNKQSRSHMMLLVCSRRIFRAPFLRCLRNKRSGQRGGGACCHPCSWPAGGRLAFVELRVFNNTPLLPTPVDCSCHFLCTHSSLPSHPAVLLSPVPTLSPLKSSLQPSGDSRLW